jgi:hypothetical protein
MSGIAPKQNAFKFKITPHKQKSIVKTFYWQEHGTLIEECSSIDTGAVKNNTAA